MKQSETISIDVLDIHDREPDRRSVSSAVGVNRLRGQVGRYGSRGRSGDYEASSDIAKRHGCTQAEARRVRDDYPRALQLTAAVADGLHHV